MKDMRRAVSKLRKQAEDELHKHRAMSSGAVVTVDYFALVRLIQYFDETQDATVRVTKARDLLENVMFSVTL